MPFTKLGLSESIQRVADAVHFTEPTPIQQQTIPLILEGADLIAQAQTGTGKTAAFALPILQRLHDAEPVPGNRPIQALVLAPTRELARQVTDTFMLFEKNLPNPVGATAIIGGEEIDNQLRNLERGAEIVVATPGRLLAMISEGHINLSHLRFLVIDEADRLLDLGFAEELEQLLSAIPETRQNLLFSATYPQKVMQLTERVMKNPVSVNVAGDELTVDNITQRIIEVNRKNRGRLLRHLLKVEPWDHVLVFVSSRRAARNLTAKLKRDGIQADEFHGDLDQDDRTWALHQFRRGKTRVLIATDIAARGIDIINLSAVINFDLPRSPFDYIHRIGRTGRAGSTGVAVTFIDHADEGHFNTIEKRIKQQPDREQVLGFERMGEAPIRTKGAPAVKGARPNKKDKARAAAAALAAAQEKDQGECAD